MFLHLLDRAQRREFCRAALHLIRADDVVDLREEELMARARAELGIADPDDVPTPPRDLDDLLDGLEVFEMTEAKNVLVLELLVLVLADGDIDEAELDELAAICRRLDVSRDAFGRLQQFARRLLDLRQDGLELLAGA
jgi:hypothetical protein